MLCGGEVAALLEVDGPSHYLADGRLRRRDLFKEALYLQVGGRTSDECS